MQISMLRHAKATNIVRRLCRWRYGITRKFEGVNGGRYWTRTSDPCDVNTVLYQLS